MLAILTEQAAYLMASLDIKIVPLIIKGMKSDSKTEGMVQGIRDQQQLQKICLSK